MTVAKVHWYGQTAFGLEMKPVLVGLIAKAAIKAALEEGELLALMDPLKPVTVSSYLGA